MDNTSASSLGLQPASASSSVITEEESRILRAPGPMTTRSRTSDQTLFRGATAQVDTPLGTKRSDKRTIQTISGISMAEGASLLDNGTSARSANLVDASPRTGSDVQRGPEKTPRSLNIVAGRSVEVSATAGFGPEGTITRTTRDQTGPTSGISGGDTAGEELTHATSGIAMNTYEGRAEFFPPRQGGTPCGRATAKTTGSTDGPLTRRPMALLLSGEGKRGGHFHGPHAQSFFGGADHHATSKMQLLVEQRTANFTEHTSGDLDDFSRAAIGFGGHVSCNTIHFRSMS